MDPLAEPSCILEVRFEEPPHRVVVTAKQCHDRLRPVGHLPDEGRVERDTQPGRFLPFIGTLFLFIATSNLLAVVPGFRPPTGSLSTTTALAMCVFVAVPLYGVAERGLGAYLKNYVRPTVFMLPFNIMPELSRTLAPGPVYETVRFCAVFGLLLLPSLLMGATFPALCTVVIRSAGGVDRHLGLVYGINTIGAAAGAAAVVAAATAVVVASSGRFVVRPLPLPDGSANRLFSVCT